MYKKIFFTIIYFLALFGIFSIYNFFNKESNQYQDIPDKKIILKQIIELSNIPINKMNCEQFKENKVVKVSDYLVEYLDLMSSKQHKLVEYTKLVCGTRKSNECYLSYGGKVEYDKGWSDILFFEYNVTSKIINPDSFECLTLH